MKSNRSTVTRRTALSGLIVLPAFARLCGSAIAYSKETKEKLGYQSFPHGDERCLHCRVFHPGKPPTGPGTCDLVQGAISPNGWCRVFVAKSK